MTLLELRGIGLEYGAIRAYTVAPGEIVGLIGDNGAGKSTLVKISTRTYRFADRIGLQPASDGRPCCRGRSIPRSDSMDKSIDLQWSRRETSSIPCPLTTGSEIVHQAKRG